MGNLAKKKGRAKGKPPHDDQRTGVADRHCASTATGIAGTLRLHTVFRYSQRHSSDAPTHFEKQGGASLECRAQ
jgi:hypothetical protein